jgi:GNAT superfamily N-acetyltransferase
LKGLTFRPLTSLNWPDLEKLFGERGACGGCWCMYWRLTQSQFRKQKGAGNKRALRRIVASGEAPGLLAYAGGEPVGWCAIAPREAYIRLEGSRILKPVDNQPVWSVVCFFVAKPFRRRGVTVALIRAATEYAEERGAVVVEGYPIDAATGTIPDVFAWTGLAPAFRKAGFDEVVRRSPTRPIMRYESAGHKSTAKTQSRAKKRKNTD